MRIVTLFAASLAGLVRAIVPTEGGGSLYSALCLLPLACLLPGRIATCNSTSVMVDNECLSATATGLRIANDAVSVANVEICAKDLGGGEHCFKIAKAAVHTYRERNGQEGYQEGGDLGVGSFNADNGPHPVECVSMGSISTAPSGKGVSPDSWQIDVETDQTDEQGNHRSVSYNGSF